MGQQLDTDIIKVFGWLQHGHINAAMVDALQSQEASLLISTVAA